jgi:hypothetical protein
MLQTGGAPLLYTNVSAMSTNDPEYPIRRKALSTAFFKSKLEMMSTVIKEVTLHHISKTFEGMQVGESKKLDAVKFFRDLQSAIIISITCGKGQHNVKLPCVTAEGTKEMPLPEMMNLCLKGLMERALQNPLVMMFPFFNDKGITAGERRFI